MKKKTLIASILTIALCLSLIAGSTFALFTSESKVNVAITAGNVEVVATVNGEVKLGSTLGENLAETSANFDETNNTITLDKIVPGDIITFDLKVENNSDVTISYRTIISMVSDNGLWKGLEVTINGTEYKGTKKISDWGTLTPGSEDIIVPVTITLPESAGDEYKLKTCTFAYTVEAVQGNAKLPVTITSENFSEINFSEADTEFVLLGEFDEIEIAALGEGSTLTFDNVTATSITLNGKNTITGENVLSSPLTTKGTKDVPAELIITDATLDMGMNALSSSQTVDATTEGIAKLVIENSVVKCGTIFVGGHSLNQPIVTAELVIKNSYVSCEESSAGSTIAVWGQDAVKAEIIDSEIHTYSRGWHQSEDVNDNSITFQGGGTIDVNIERSNMHFYGARSIINARKYGNQDATVNFAINESLIWVVTKSTHAEETLPVWGITEDKITDTILLFTKGAYKGSEVVKSWVYGNPVIHGDYAVVTQCGWDAAINVTGEQIITFASDANVSVYEGAASVNFVLSGSASVVIENGTNLMNIGVVAADGYTLNKTVADGNIIYTVAAE